MLLRPAINGLAAKAKHDRFAVMLAVGQDSLAHVVDDEEAIALLRVALRTAACASCGALRLARLRYHLEEGAVQLGRRLAQRGDAAQLERAAASLAQPVRRTSRSSNSSAPCLLALAARACQGRREKIAAPNHGHGALTRARRAGRLAQYRTRAGPRLCVVT